MKDTCKIGGIIQHRNGGYGFKISFNSVGLARKYKEMMGWIIAEDKVLVVESKGYNDRKE